MLSRSLGEDDEKRRLVNLICLLVTVRGSCGVGGGGASGTWAGIIQMSNPADCKRQKSNCNRCTYSDADLVMMLRCYDDTRD